MLNSIDENFYFEWITKFKIFKFDYEPLQNKSIYFVNMFNKINLCTLVY